MNEKSFQERMRSKIRRYPSVFDGSLSIKAVSEDDALQIAKAADEALKEKDRLIEILMDSSKVLQDSTTFLVAEACALRAEIAAARSPIIFDPADPRVEIGKEYEFSNAYNFFGDNYGACQRGLLIEADRMQYFVGPFFCDREPEQPYTFIREIKE